MTLAQVQAAVAIFVALMVSLTGLLTSVAILLPVHTRKADQALEKSRTHCFLTGLGLLVVGVIGFICLSIPAPIIKLIGAILLLILGAVATLGGAGMALLMGRRISEMSGAKTSFGALVRGSVAYSVGVFFPFIGWYVLAPLTILCGLGAGFAALRPTPNPNARPNATPGNWYPQQAMAGAGFAGGMDLPVTAPHTASSAPDSAGANGSV